MGKLSVFFHKDLPRSFLMRGEPCFDANFKNNYASLKIANLWENVVFLYISILKPEKYVNCHNFSERLPFEFRFGQKADINEINICGKFC